MIRSASSVLNGWGYKPQRLGVGWSGFVSSMLIQRSAHCSSRRSISNTLSVSFISFSNIRFNSGICTSSSNSSRGTFANQLLRQFSSEADKVDKPKPKPKGKGKGKSDSAASEEGSLEESSEGVSMDNIVALCKRKGFIFSSNDIYDTVPGFFDYGPLGVELKNNIKRIWWREMVHKREDMVGMDCAIVGSSQVWTASGHVKGFSDPMVDCKVSNLRYRADQVFWAALRRESDNSEVCVVSVLESGSMQELATAAALKKAKQLKIDGPFKPLQLRDLTECPSEDDYKRIPSPATGEIGHLTPPRSFNLMFQTQVGAVKDDASIAYLRPETAQGIFTNFANVQRTSRMKIPFGIAQIGKAFRNEITPRNFIFRSREFEQMEIEYFITPHDEAWKKHLDDWITNSLHFLKVVMGIPEDKLSLHKHGQDKLAHYAVACTDITFDFLFGKQELMGIAARGDYDLKQHSLGSGKALEYTENSNDKNVVKFVPHVIEPSLGVDRLVLALLTSVYREEVLANGEKRIVLGFKPYLAPVKAAILPVVSNKPELVEAARKVHLALRSIAIPSELDMAGAIGRRYRRADESGIPMCVTIDYETLSDNTVTVRDRDSMKQTRIHIDAISDYIRTAVQDP